MRPNRDTYFVNMLELVSRRSTCGRRDVGAIITDSTGRVLSMGYNGVPAGFDHCTLEAPCPGFHDMKGDTRRCLAIHAESNSLLQCHRLDLAYTMYVSCCPCFSCAKLIMNTNIQRVVAVVPYATDGAQELLQHHRRLYYYDFESNEAKISASR